MVVPHGEVWAFPATFEDTFIGLEPSKAPDTLVVIVPCPCPRGDGFDDRAQSLTFFGEYIFRGRRRLPTHPHQESFAFKLLQALGQHSVGQAGNGRADTVKPFSSAQQRKDDHAIPAASQQFDCVMKGLAVPSARFVHSRTLKTFPQPHNGLTISKYK